ncbi:hypothetical protein Tco_0944850 [Tanacetum coccineum]
MTSLIKESLMRIVHKLLVRSLVHRAGSKERCQKRDIWMMSALEESQEPIEYETWAAKMLANKLDEATHTLMQTEQVAPQAGQARKQRNKPIGLDSNQSNFAYPAYEPPNLPPYPYLYVPYPHPYTHYPDLGSPSFGGDHYGSHGDGYHTGSIFPSSGYEIGGSSAGFHRDDNFDPIVHSEDCVASDDDDMRD